MVNNRKGTPDIIGNLMGIKPASNKAIKHEGNKTTKQKTNLEIEKQEANKEISMVSNKASLVANHKKTIEPEKEKATFNISRDTLKQLDDTWITFRRSKIQKVTKTLIVETAVELALAEFEAKGELSQLYRMLKDIDSL